MDIWFGVWIILSDYGLSLISLAVMTAPCICFYPSVSHVLAHLKSPAFLWLSVFISISLL